MDRAAKKVSIAIIVILILVIGGFWYTGNKKNRSLNNQTELLGTSGSTIKLDKKTHDAYAITDQEIDNLIATVAQATSSEKKPAPYNNFQDVYNLNNIRYTGNETQATLINYGKQVANVLRNLGSQENGSKLVLAGVANNDPEIIAKLNELTQTYRTAEKNLSAIATPKSAGPIQVKILNNLNRLAKSSANMSAAQGNDPEKVLFNSSIYEMSLSALYVSFDDLNKFFITRQIKFNSSDQVEI